MDQNQFEAILRDNGNRIYRYLLKFVKNHDDAEDLVQSVFISFYAKMADIEEKNATAYLYRAAHNQALNYKKQQQRYIPTPIEGFYNIATPVEEADNPHIPIVKNAITSLPPRLAAVVELQIYEKLSYKEIANKLKMTVSAVESLLVRARRQLKKKIMQDIKDKEVL